jgi:hypothetical protein
MSKHHPVMVRPEGQGSTPEGIGGRPKFIFISKTKAQEHPIIFLTCKDLSKLTFYKFPKFEFNVAAATHVQRGSIFFQ